MSLLFKLQTGQVKYNQVLFVKKKKKITQSNQKGAQLDNLFRESAMACLRENVNNTKVKLFNIMIYERKYD